MSAKRFGLLGSGLLVAACATATLPEGGDAGEGSGGDDGGAGAGGAKPQATAGSNLGGRAGSSAFGGTSSSGASGSSSGGRAGSAGGGQGMAGSGLPPAGGGAGAAGGGGASTGGAAAAGTGGQGPCEPPSGATCADASPFCIGQSYAVGEAVKATCMVNTGGCIPGKVWLFTCALADCAAHAPGTASADGYWNTTQCQ